MTSLGRLVREMRLARRSSLRDLARAMAYHHGYVGKIEQGERFPERQFAELADQVLLAGGAILAAWEAENARRAEAARVRRLMTSSTNDSLQLVTSLGTAHDADALIEEADRLAVEYCGSAAVEAVSRLVDARAELVRRLRAHDFRPNQLTDLYLALGRVQGVLAYAALDLGEPHDAMAHANGSWVCAERAGSNELGAWVRGTQSLILRFTKQFERAEQHARDGLRYPVTGTGRLRLLSGVAQCRANLGDGAQAVALLNQVRTEREALTTTDPVQGLFTFTLAKQHYYVASSMMWLDGHAELRRAADEAMVAVSMWDRVAPENRAKDDQVLARIYAATANVKRRRVNEAAGILAPVLALPPQGRISWVVKRLDNLVTLLTETKGREQTELRNRIRRCAEPA